MELLAFIKDMLKVSSNPKNILKLFDVGACPRDGVSRLWSLRRRSRCRLDCARRSKYLWFPYHRAEDTTLINSSLRQINRVWSCQSACIATDSLSPPSNEPIYVNQRHCSWESWQHAAIPYKWQVQKYWRNAADPVSNILRARSKRLTDKLLALSVALSGCWWTLGYNHATSDGPQWVRFHRRLSSAFPQLPWIDGHQTWNGRKWPQLRVDKFPRKFISAARRSGWAWVKYS